MMASDTMVAEAFADVRAALGQIPADRVLERCRLVNVCSGEVYRADIALRGSRIVAVREQFEGPAHERLDCSDLYAAPGMVVRHTAEDGPLDAATLTALGRLGVTSLFVDAECRCAKATNAPRRYIVGAGGSSGTGAPLQPQTLAETSEAITRAVRNGIAVRVATQGAATGDMVAALKRRSFPLTHFWLHPASTLGPEALADCLNRALQGGCTPAELFRMLSFTPAMQYRMEHEVGSLAPGRRADILLLHEPGSFPPAGILCGGVPVNAGGVFSR